MKHYGSGNLAITNIQEVRATQEFLGLEESVRDCQQDEEREECQEKMYLDKVQSVCGCTPLNFNDFSEDEVTLLTFRFHKNFFVCNILQGNLCRSDEQLGCWRNISVSEVDCPDKCDGIILSVRHDAVKRYHEDGFRELLREYDSYKCWECSNFPPGDGLSGAPQCLEWGWFVYVPKEAEMRGFWPLT